MLVANPIYDVVFRYLLDDEAVARQVLSALLGEEVLTLQSRPMAVPPGADKEDNTPVLVLRMAFAATVRREDGGEKRVLIEIQKARTAGDVQRFWRYLGTSDASPENRSLDPDGNKQALPIVTIYLLGQGLECVDVPVVAFRAGQPAMDVDRLYLDVATGAGMRITDPFVEAFTHDSIVVQINRLKDRRRTELERMLAVFGPGLTSRSGPHRVDILEKDFPEPYRDVLHRLMRAGAEQKILDTMDFEDEIWAAFRDEVRKSADLRQALVEKQKALAEKQKALAEKQKALAGKQEALAEKQESLDERNQMIGVQDRLLADLQVRDFGA